MDWHSGWGLGPFWLEFACSLLGLVWFPNTVKNMNVSLTGDSKLTFGVSV